MDERAEKLLDAGRAALSLLPQLLGADAPTVGAELRAAIAEAERTQESWRLEAVRDILRRNPSTRSWLEQRVPEATSPRGFTGRWHYRSD